LNIYISDLVRSSPREAIKTARHGCHGIMASTRVLGLERRVVMPGGTGPPLNHRIGVGPQANPGLPLNVVLY